MWSRTSSDFGKVLSRLKARELSAKKKWNFLADSIEYVRFIIGKNGKHISLEKTTALYEDAQVKRRKPAPVFLGMRKQTARCLSNFPDKCTMFHELPKKNVLWCRTDECQKPLDVGKQEVMQTTLLVHFDKLSPLVLAADAFQYGIGAVINHRLNDETKNLLRALQKSFWPRNKTIARPRKKL